MPSVKFAKRADLAVIEKIVGRAEEMAEKHGFTIDRLSLSMDISAVHANGNPLRLDDFLKADDFNFTHDIHGIRAHIDRKTGKLKDFFLPRFSRPEASHAH